MQKNSQFLRFIEFFKILKSQKPLKLQRVKNIRAIQNLQTIQDIQVVQNTQIIQKIQTILFLLLLPSFFFSYHPRILLFSTSDMNFELSLPIIILGLLALSSLFTVKSSLQALENFLIHHFRTKNYSKGKTRQSVKKHHFFQFKNYQLFQINPFPLKFLFIFIFAFPVYLTISVFWSKHPIRGILTVGLFWAIILSVLTIPNIIINEKIKNKLVKSYLLSATLVAIFCWISSILDILQFSQNFTLMCDGCTFISFGFPHPNGFAIEPQFMGNLLIFPTLVSFYLVIQSKKYISLAILFATTLFFTFSRGAIYSLVLSVVILTFILFLKKQKSIFLSLMLTFVSFVMSLIAQGIFAELSPTPETFLSGTTKALHHLTLGQLDLRPATPKHIPDSHSGQSDTDLINRSNLSNSTTTPTNTPTFSGYVKESTDIRLNLNNYALDLWNDSPNNLIFGVGIGSSGHSLYQKFNQLGSAKEIVQNQYVSLLLETGLLGYLFLFILGLILIKLYSFQSSAKPYLTASLFATLISLLFFSGLPNALHLYLLPFIGSSILNKTTSTQNYS